MSYFEFLAQIASAPLTYVGILAVMVGAYVLVLRRQLFSVFDPMTMAVISTALAAVDVVFLWWRNLMDARYLWQFATTEVAFFTALMLAAPRAGLRGRSGAPAGTASDRFLSALYVVSATVFVTVQVVTYAVHGIPMFYDSRLEYTQSGGGFGALERVLNITWFFSSYLLVFRFARRVRIEGWPVACDGLVGIALLGSAVLSGSRATFLPVLFALAYFRFVHRDDDAVDRSVDRALKRVQTLTIMATVAAAILVIGAKMGGGLTAVWLDLYERFASYGDVYFMAYPTHIIDSISGKHGFLALFGGLLIMFRLVPPSSVPEVLGFQLHRAVYGYDAFVGPNPRHNVFGVIYFGEHGAVLYSFLLGLVVALIRRYAARLRPGGAAEPLVVFLAISSVAAVTDFGAVMKDVGSVILVVPALYALALAVSGIPVLDRSRRERLLSGVAAATEG